MKYINKKIIITQLILFLFSVCFSQPTKSFVVVHCDPNEAYNFPNLEILVDTANAYNIKLTLEFTSAWIDSILPFQSRLNKLIIWQSQGHEIGLHHHEITAKGIWDGYSNFSMTEIHNAGRDTNLLIGNTDSLYNLVQQITQQPIKTVGVQDSTALPSQSLYQTTGHEVSDGYSNPFSFIYNNKQFSRVTHCFADTSLKTQQLISQYPTMSIYDIIGVNTHVYDFVNEPMALISFFNFINSNNNITPLTVSEILNNHNPVDIRNNINSQLIHIKPNPVNNILNIETKEKIQYIKLYDATGRSIKKITLNKKRKINTSDLIPGVYFLEFILDNKSTTHKFIKN